MLAARLRERFRKQSNVRVIEGDTLRVPLPEQPFRVVANIPFGRTMAILRLLLDDPGVPLQHGDLIVEWGVACKRAACWPSTMLNVCWGAMYEFGIARRLPAACFEPMPRVDAAVLRVHRRPVPLVDEATYDSFRSLVEKGFRNDPSLRRALACYLPPRRFKQLARELGFRPSSMARELDLSQWVALHRDVRGIR